MKTIALFCVVLLAMGSVTGFAMPDRIDALLEDQSKSDIRPVAEVSSLVYDVTNSVDKTVHNLPIIRDRDIVLEPIRNLSHAVVKGAKAVVNGTLDIVNLKGIRL